MTRALVLIPSRYQSTRFPGKPLVPLLGKSLIQRVWQNMSVTLPASRIKLDPWVVTDDERIETHVKSFGGQVVRVDDDVASGSERIALALERFFKQTSYEFVVNVQGDEPLLTAHEVERLVGFHLQSNFDITTLYRHMKEDILNPNRVKAVVGENGRCLYFSRAPVPFQAMPWNQHIGVYSYRPNALDQFFRLPVSELEKLERLEQLRALEAGLSIGALLSNLELYGVDTPDDITLVEGVLRGKGK